MARLTSGNMTNIAQNVASAALSTGTFTPGNRYGSFSGIREGVAIRWYVDGEDYFAAVADALEAARETIFIEDWWLSPQVFLKRPAAGQLTWRLDQLLKRKAEQGVHVYVVLYKEIELALALKSKYVKMNLQALHPNIKVQRHPDPAQSRTLFWAHHEKMCIVDSKVAFIGGLDLCFGRWDTHSHRLADPTGIMWQGQDYNNPRRRDFVDPDQYEVTLIDRQVYGRMPWHDVSLSMHGLAALDVARHFCERWNFIKKLKAADKPEIPILTPSMRNAEAEQQTMRGTCRVQVVRSSAEWSSGVPHERSIQNAYIDLIANAEHFIMIENQFFISNPMERERAISNHIACAIMNRIFRAVNEGKRFRVIVLMPLMPAFQSEIDDDAASTLRLVMHYQYSTICRGGHSMFELLQQRGINPDDYISFYGLRNYDLIRDKSQYELGEALLAQYVQMDEEHDKVAKKQHEKSRHTVVRLFNKIFRRDHADEDDKEPEPEVVAESAAKAEALKDLREDALFVSELLYIHTKLMIIDDRIAICGSANINDRSMCGNRDSEIAAVIEDTQMINSVMNGQPYKVGKLIHELRMSLFREHLGLTLDTQMKALCYLPPNAKPPHLPEIMKQIEGNSAIALRDPLSNAFWQLWDGTARRNTLIYRKLFRVVPDDTVTTFAELKAFRPNPKETLAGHVIKGISLDQIKQEIFQIQGHLVTFPTQFMKNEVLRAAQWSAESVTPENVFT